MKWLWKDWPKPSSGAGLGSRKGSGRSLIPGEEWQLVGGDTSSPRAVRQRQGEVFYNDVGSKTCKVGLDGKVSVFIAATQSGGTAKPSGPTASSAPSAGEPERILAYDEAEAARDADGFKGTTSWS